MTTAGRGGFRLVDEETIHQGAVIRTASGTFEAPDGTRFQRDLVHHPGAVAVVALQEDRSVVLVRQYRAAIDRWLLEIPAGKRDVPGEAPEVTAGRELAEEVGRRAGRLERLATFHNSAGFSDEYTWLYLATDLTETPLDRQGVEEQSMTVETVPLSAVDDLIASGELTDAKTVIGLLLTQRRLERPGTA